MGTWLPLPNQTKQNDAEEKKSEIRLERGRGGWKMLKLSVMTFVRRRVPDLLNRRLHQPGVATQLPLQP